MAITRVGVMANPPTNIGDYTHILAHLDAYAKQVGNQGMLLTQWGNASGVPAIAKGSYISHGGTLFVVDTEDFLVAAPASNGTYYLRVAESGASLAISWVTSIGGYTWNAIYNGLYDGSENQILPYMLIKTGAVLEKWKISNLMQGGNFNRVDYLGRVIMGALTCASVDTGSGPISGASVGVTGEISGASINTAGLGNFLIGQNLRTTDSPTFAEMITGNGPKKFTYEEAVFTSNTQTIYMSTMISGELKMVYARRSGGNLHTLRLPSGGSFLVFGYGYFTAGESTAVRHITTSSLWSGGSEVGMNISDSMFANVLVYRI